MTDSTPQPAAPTLRVLMVEDSEDDAVLIQHHLRKHGYDVQALRVETLEEMRSALDQPWDIVLSDHNMPDMSSLRGLALLRERDLDIPFILVSGTIGEAQAVAAMKAGAHDFVMKDRLGRLVPVIERELNDAAQRHARRAAEENLRRSEGRYRELVEEIPAVTYIAALDERRTVYFMSNQINRWLGIDAAAQRSLWENFTHPEDRGAMEEVISRALESGSAFTCEYRFQRADGSIIWVRDHAVVVRESADHPPFARGFLIDISEQRAIEASLRERDQQLQRAQKLESIGRLAGGVAHDFNNLLTPILGYGRLLAESLPPDSELREFASEVVRSSERAAKLTRQLLAFSRQRNDLARPVDLNQAVTEMHRFLRSTIGREIDLSTVLGETPAVVLIDPTALEQAVVNLAVNARDAMSSGGRLTIGIAVDRVSPSVAAAHHVEPGPYIRLSVRDTGAGMTKEIRDKIFEPFFTTKPEGRGTGLGLAIVREVVSKNHGFIELTTAPGEGSEFRLFFPQHHQAAAAVDEHPIQLPSGSEHILVVDDDEVVGKLVARHLKSLGYHVTLTTSAGEAIEHYTHAAPPVDALVTDLVMPHGSGRALAETLCAGQPDLPVLFISGFSQDSPPEGARPRQILLMKPFSKEALATALREVLDQR
ncbi:MAG TPA: response regulator [Kiritimatiellia bacterium]|nr:response regulator [Kiritimatiellia bacterium]